jgi:hypothetical protein
MVSSEAIVHHNRLLDNAYSASDKGLVRLVGAHIEVPVVRIRKLHDERVLDPVLSLVSAFASKLGLSRSLCL